MVRATQAAVQMLDDQIERSDRERLAELLRERDKRDRQRMFFQIFPDETVYAPDGSVAKIPGTDIELWGRDLYPRHMEFFEAGATYRERGVIAANRIGKTFSLGAFETTAHLTGLYPEWWKGRRFKNPVSWWAAGETNESTRDTVQHALLGTVEGVEGRKSVSGTGMIPGRAIDKITWKQGVQNFVDTIRVKHVNGGCSLLGFKAYQQGAPSFAGTAKHGVWLDELAPEDVWGECITRTATTNGMIYLTVTPIKGLWGAVRGFFAENV